jgi:hypothetical protein
LQLCQNPVAVHHRLPILLVAALTSCLITPAIRDDRQAELDRIDPAVIVRVLHDDGRPMDGAEVTVTDLAGNGVDPDDVIGNRTDAAGWIARWPVDAGGKVVVHADAGVRFAPSSTVVDVQADAVGVTLTLAQLQTGSIAFRSQTVNEDGRHSLALPPSVFERNGLYNYGYAFANDGVAPPALGERGSTLVVLDVFDAVFLGSDIADLVDVGEDLVYRVHQASGSRLEGSEGAVALWEFDVGRGLWLESGFTATRETSTHWTASINAFGRWYALAAEADSAEFQIQVFNPGGGGLADAELRVTELGLAAPKRYQTSANGTADVRATAGHVDVLRRQQFSGRLALVDHHDLGLDGLGITASIWADADGDFFWADGRCGSGDCEAAYRWGDCNDAEKKIFPGANETDGDGVDSDCDDHDGVDADRDGSTATAIATGFRTNSKWKMVRTDRQTPAWWTAAPVIAANGRR